MTCDQLSLLADDYVDTSLEPATSASVRRHLAACAACRTLVDDVARIRDTARALGPVEPPARLWSVVQTRLQLEARTAPRGGWLQLMAAAAGLVLVVSGLTWVGARLDTPPADLVVATGPAVQFQLAEAAYQTAIDDLESIATLVAAPALTEPALAALQAGLVDVDAAIDEARDRLSAEPDDEFAQDSLLAALDSKVVLLQDTVALLDQDRADIEGLTE